MTLIIAEGPSFTFHVIEHTRHAAMRRLRKAFSKHLRQCRVPAPLPTVEDALTVNVIEDIVIGAVYRDYEVIQ